MYKYTETITLVRNHKLLSFKKKGSLYFLQMAELREAGDTAATSSVVRSD